MVTPAALPLTELDAEGRTLQFGATATGEMTASDQVEASMFQAWEFQGTAGESVTIDLMSDQFDAYLYLVGPGLTQPLTDDDGGEGLNSRIATTIPATGTYRVIVSMLGQDTGFFTLRVSRNP